MSIRYRLSIIHKFDINLECRNKNPCLNYKEIDSMAVFDSNRNLKNNLRTDFERIKPKWFIEVKL